MVGVLCSKLTNESDEKGKLDSDFSHFSFLRAIFFCALTFIFLVFKIFQDISMSFCYNGSFGTRLGIYSFVSA
jgi:hypothetical protein